MRWARGGRACPYTGNTMDLRFDIGIAMAFIRMGSLLGVPGMDSRIMGTGHTACTATKLK